MASTVTTFSQARGTKRWAKNATGLEYYLGLVATALNDHASDLDALNAGSITNGTVFSSNTQSASVDTTLSSFANLHVLTMTAASKYWTLPSASASGYEGLTINIVNGGATNAFGIKDNSGTIIVASVRAGESVMLQLEDNSTAAGTWRDLRPKLNAISGVTISSVGLYDILMDAGSGSYVDVAPSSARTFLGLAIGTDVQAYDADTLKADTADVLTAGFANTSYSAGTFSSGTYTPNEANGNMQHATNNGAHTLAPPTNSSTIIIEYTNGASAGAITTTGFDSVKGAFTTTNGDVFQCTIIKTNTKSSLFIEAMQ